VAGGRCTPPKSVTVRPYTRKPRKAKRAVRAPKPGVNYYECVQWDTGRRCGIKHRTFTAGVAHRKKLDKTARAAKARGGGKLHDWKVDRFKG
jgi:hypothetical protein